MRRSSTISAMILGFKAPQQHDRRSDFGISSAVAARPAQ
jgi:hypothetical protein